MVAQTSLLLRAVEGLERKRGLALRQTLLTMQRLVDLYELWQRPEPTASWRRQLTEAQAERSGGV